MKVSVSILSFFKFSFHGSRRLEAIPLLLSLLRLCSFKGRCHQRHITLWHGWRKMRPIGKDVLRALWSPSIPIREPSSFKWFFHTPPSHHYQPYICQKEKARHFSGRVLFTKYFPPQFTSYRLTIDPNILLQLMEWLGGLARTADPSLASHAVSCLPVSHLPPTQPTNVCLLVLPLKPPWRGVVCLWWGGFSCLLPLCQTWTIWSSSTLSTAGRQLLLGQTAPPSVCCIISTTTHRLAPGTGVRGTCFACRWNFCKLPPDQGLR